MVVGTGANGGWERGVVVEMEYRRRSGRGVGEWFFLPPPSDSVLAKGEKLVLLDDHPLFGRTVVGGGKGEEEGEGPGSTFELGLTDKQRRDREGVVLPYFDAQRVGGAGEGGRILYDMGVEDDFDEEEDEI